MDSQTIDLPIHQPLSGVAMHAFLALAAESRPDRIPLAIARATCHAVLADLCYLISTPEDGKITCFDGFNRIKEEVLSGVILPVDHFKEVDESFSTGKPILFNDLTGLSENTRNTLSILGQIRVAPFCLVPITTTSRDVLGGILLLSPFSGREWNQEDINQVISINDSLARILEKVLESTERDERLKALEEQPKTNVESSGAWFVEATGETVPAVEQQSEAEPPITTRTGIYLKQPPSLCEIYRVENDLLLYEITNLRQSIEQLAASTALAASAQTNESTRTALEEIRTDLRDMLSPLSAITGYHDLLLSESVGTLTTMQQRFLDRIRNAADKLHLTIDHIDQVAMSGVPNTGKAEIQPTVSLQKIIDESFRNFQQLIHERNLEVRMLIPDGLPQVKGTQNEIQPVVNKILNSLLSITPNKSHIQSRLALQVELDGKKNVLWKATTHAETEILPGKELDEFSEYLQENVFSLAERLHCQLWMDAAVHTERQVNLLFSAG
jgi:signal transduction histidine kinase